mgnify:CR=1 FL=1
MRTFHLTALLLIAITSLTSTAVAQNSNSNRKVIEARTLCYARSADVTQIYIQGAKKKEVVEIFLPKESISRRFKCVVQNDKAVFYKNGKAGEDGKPEIIPLAVARVPANQTKVLFYFIPNKAGSKLPYSVKTFADDYETFPLGYTRVINLTPTPTRFIIGEHKAVVKEGKMQDFPLVKKKDNFNMGVFRYDQRNKAKQWVTIRNRTAKYTKGKRLLIIACYNERLKRPDVRIYKDLPEPKAEAAPAPDPGPE